ncbi:universal stress protein [Polaromonas jejuensis]|uniref:Universal stress protein n=1 Tax=Polaromonas jejuensis TaxID=457502 RepID=A0ABW0QBR6_9BURK|nr:universal stress protein [Polaromonas jejuensis]
MFKHILIATDGSPTSEHAAQLAVSLARIHGAKLTVVYVADPYPFLSIGESNPLGFQSYMAAAQGHAAQAHATVEALCNQDGPAVTLQARMVENVTASAGIVQMAKDEGADLIVVGSHGRSGIIRLMLGSVASKVVAESPVPVLVAR